MANSKILCLLYLITLSATQTTFCVWNSKDDFDHLNGEYTLGGTWNTHSYWQRSTPSCPDTTQYLFAAWYAPDDLHYWFFYPQLVNDWIQGFPDCAYDEDILAADPSQCKHGWYLYNENKEIYTELTLTVKDESCPSLTCDAIQLSNTLNDKCDTTFYKDSSKTNVFYSSGSSTYLYFNPYTFKWYCSDILDHNNCADDSSITHAHLTNNKDNWKALSSHGDTFVLAMSNGERATFKCIETLKPTAAPHPTVEPTNIPTYDPTFDPTQAPTIKPTLSPTAAPTLIPTNHPTINPTTRAPTPPGTLLCGEQDVGPYNGEALEFMINNPKRGDVRFDVSHSNFEVGLIEVFTESEKFLETDYDNDEIVIIYDQPPGNYKLVIGGNTEQGWTYDVRTICSSKNPTKAPTNIPTSTPTKKPSKTPTKQPSGAPTFWPTWNPTQNPTQTPSDQPTTEIPTFEPSEYPTNSPLLVSTEAESVDKESEKEASSKQIINAVGIMIGSFVGSCLCLGALVYAYHHRQEIEENAKRSSMMTEETFHAPTIATDTQTEAKGEDTEREKADEVRAEKQPANVKPANVKPAKIQKVASIEVEGTESDESTTNDSLFGTIQNVTALGVEHATKYVEKRPVTIEAAGTDTESVESTTDEFIGKHASESEIKIVAAHAAEPGAMIADKVGECVDCAQYKKGKVYQGDGSFYCDECWMQYDM